MISSLLEKADEDFLVEPIVHGVPKSTKLVLGKEQFTLQELKSLPRLSDSKTTAHDVYIDPVRIGDTVTNWKLYVIPLPVNMDLGPNTDKTHHAQVIKKVRRTMNLRCDAHFGFDPDLWFNHLAGSIFMLSFGT
jgi:hypothetical protein